LRSSLVRLVHLCADRGLCGVNEAKEFIALGLVSVDGKVVDRGGGTAVGGGGVWVERDAEVQLLPRAQRVQASKVTVLLNKPLHYLTYAAASSTAPPSRRLLTAANRHVSCSSRIDLAKCRKLHPTDQLDADTTGLVVFTQDGRVVSLLSGRHGGVQVEREYHVQVRGRLDGQVLGLLRHGLTMDGIDLLPCQVDQVMVSRRHSKTRTQQPRKDDKAASGEGQETASQLSSEDHQRTGHPADDDDQRKAAGDEMMIRSDGALSVSSDALDEAAVVDEWPSALLRFILKEDRPRQVRRMCAMVGLEVERVHRVRIGKVDVSRLPLGRWRLMTKYESFV